MDKTTPNSTLIEFVRAAKQQGAGDEFLASLLTRQGWSAEDVFAALGTYWQETTGLAVPRRSGGTESSREAYLYLLSFLTLAIWASALGTILFQLVNLWVPDPVQSSYTGYIRTTVTWSMAALAVSFPLYLLIARVQVRESEANPDRLHTGVRKWLTYMALLITAGTVVGDLIGFVGYFLLGELTLRFALKAGIVLLICGGVFTYYMSSLPGSGKISSLLGQRWQRLFAWASMAVVAATFVAGITVTGKPSEQRSLQADQRRVGDLRAIAHAVEQWRNTQRTLNTAAGATLDGSTDPGLPNDLEVLRQQQRIQRVADPETGESYRYQAMGNNTYKLCAVFNGEYPREGERTQPHSDFWNHPKGEHCYVLDAAKAVPW